MRWCICTAGDRTRRIFEDGDADSDGRPINYERNEPRDKGQGYISEQHYAFVGFGAGTLADMQLTSLLFVQIFAALWSTILNGAVGEETSFLRMPVSSPTSAVAWATSACGGAFALPVIAHGGFSEDGDADSDGRPINYERNEPRDKGQGYISEQHYAFVGFGAGTLADMQLTSLLFVQSQNDGLVQEHKWRAICLRAQVNLWNGAGSGLTVSQVILGWHCGQAGHGPECGDAVPAAWLTGGAIAEPEESCGAQHRRSEHEKAEEDGPHHAVVRHAPALESSRLEVSSLLPVRYEEDEAVSVAVSCCCDVGNEAVESRRR
ncbi:hypothetical protein HPB50_014701 [Hyalomma asiaticum]|uniref:Uncharacterized protein n=1 Tax=Hyalomma asiaticum TaxID=266040 RepID=A0ACB7SSU0_HYAAI|nr:hypothetical protein HPB50_014701 [Hyalomma asiaticum]